jgi:hypothetical protein
MKIENSKKLADTLKLKKESAGIKNILSLLFLSVEPR